MRTRITFAPWWRRFAKGAAPGRSELQRERRAIIEDKRRTGAGDRLRAIERALADLENCRGSRERAARTASSSLPRSLSESWARDYEVSEPSGTP